MSKAKALLFDVPLKAAQQWWNDDAMTLAAALAFYTMFSLAPLVVVSLAVAGAIVGHDVARGELGEQLGTLIGPQGAKVVEDTLTNASQENDIRSLAGLIGFVTLLIGATGVFAQLQASLNAIWGVKPNPGSARRTLWLLVRTRLLSFGMVLAIGFLLLVSQIVTFLLAGFHHYMDAMLPGVPEAWQALNLIISLALVSLLFALMFKLLPDVKISWGDVWIGAVVTSVLFGIGRYLVGFYLGNSAVASTYGAAGSLVVVLIWAWFAGCILYYGAEYTQVYSRNYGAQIAPAPYAVRTDRDRAKPDADVDNIPGKRPPEPGHGVRKEPPKAERKNVIASQRLSAKKRRRGGNG